jgi:hypothetical protein
MRIIFTRIGCTLLTCDMYMSDLRHIHDPVLSSLKMEGIRYTFFQNVGMHVQQNTALQFRRLGAVRILTVVKISNLLVCIMRAYLFELVFTL